MARAWAWSAVLCAAIATPSAADILIVDGSGTVYSDLPAAVSAAPDGAALLVGPGSYSGFTISDKSL
ncbi:MAG: nitrous oxide reductase family maturation protein NosD, partial [Planctomycetes bacterium]|nr:nitrous oxide reductase family maturation protein NosD [Planctomycetota bacterium]